MLLVVDHVRVPNMLCEIERIDRLKDIVNLTLHRYLCLDFSQTEENLSKESSSINNLGTFLK